jgi:hypothetical protein
MNREETLRYFHNLMRIANEVRDDEGFATLFAAAWAAVCSAYSRGEVELCDYHTFTKTFLAACEMRELKGLCNDALQDSIFRLRTVLVELERDHPEWARN